MSVPITSHGLSGMLWCIIFSVGCVCLNSRHGSTIFYICFYIRVYIMPEHRFTGKHFSFSVPMWFVCSCVSTCCFRLSGMIMHLPLGITASFTASSSLYSQYSLMLVCSSSLVCGLPAIINVFSCWRWISCDDTCCISSMDVHSGMSTELWMVSTHTSISFIGLSLPSTWLFLNSQSAVKISWARFV